MTLFPDINPISRSNHPMPSSHTTIFYQKKKKKINVTFTSFFSQYLISVYRWLKEAESGGIVMSTLTLDT